MVSHFELAVYTVQFGVFVNTATDTNLNCKYTLTSYKNKYMI